MITYRIAPTDVSAEAFDQEVLADKPAALPRQLPPQS